MASPVRSSRYRFLSLSWVHRASHTPRRYGARSCRIGSRHMSAPSLISAASPARRLATISRPGSPRPAFTSRPSTGPTPTWRGITAPPSFRRAPISHATRPRLEVGVQVVGRWILARLRHQRFFSLAELNAAIRALLDELNNRSMRGWGTSRRPLFEQLDKPALRSLPPLAYEYAEWKRCRVGLDYHVEIAKHYYSVPHQLIRQEVEARITAGTIEIFHRGKRIASHRRSLRPHRPTTVPEHMPSAHRRYRDWTHERIRHEAQAVGPDAAVLVDVILRSRPHPEQGFRSCVGILRLVKRYGAERVDAACARALVLCTRSYASVAPILKTRRERAPTATAEPPLLIHENIRGPGYYH